MNIKTQTSFKSRFISLYVVMDMTLQSLVMMISPFIVFVERRYNRLLHSIRHVIITSMYDLNVLTLTSIDVAIAVSLFGSTITYGQTLAFKPFAHRGRGNL